MRRNPREEAARLFNRERFEAANRGDNDGQHHNAWARHIMNIFNGIEDEPQREEGPRSSSGSDSNATSISIPSSVSFSRALSCSSSRSFSRSSSLDNFLELLEQRRAGRFSSSSSSTDRSRSMENIPLFVEDKKEGKRIDVVKPLRRFRNIAKDQVTGEPSCLFCVICGDANSIMLMTAPVPCTHRCCVECFRDYLAHQIQQVHSLLIKCPQTYCTLTHPPNYWSEYIPLKVAQRKELALLESKRIEQIGTRRRAAFLHYTSWC